MNVMNETELLKAQLDTLRREHRHLDQKIAALDESASGDTLTLKRLKKQKLAYKDQISRLEDRLYPDIIA